MFIILQEKSIQEDHHNAFVENIGKVLFGQDQKKHIRDILNVSNTNDEDGVFEKIRKRISELASEMKSWGVEIPLKWFLFQQVIEKLKENKVPISTTKNVQQMASHKYIGITDDADFRKCLLYFHDVGTIIYYDEEGLNENVILDPKWLIDAFRCLVSHQISNETKIGDDWCTLQQTGQITTSLLGKLLQKKTDYTIDFQGHKEYLIEVMKKFDIIVSMKDSPFLYMPCMMTDCSLDFVKGNFITATFDKTSWLCLRFDFLPPVFFNHIIARYMKVYNVISAMDKGKGVIKHALYRKIAVFKLPDSGCKQLILCQAPNILAVQICFSKANDIKDYSKYRKDLDTFVQNLKSRYKLHIVYKVELACKDGDIELGRTSLCDLNEPEYRCKSHKNNIHSSGELLDWWYTKDEFVSFNIHATCNRK
ncbi:Hypothetical predicted protein [Mytilus galloprovincialis]|uniref:COR domain-containing protein n=1 Tax=Mytilus galloprovincialis TaxID=29158 RepID=A0A8B6DUQ7_MYTGA|nr:Hypothetical predicted protein [Mytilus galloprovincialis]